MYGKNAAKAVEKVRQQGTPPYTKKGMTWFSGRSQFVLDSFVAHRDLVWHSCIAGGSRPSSAIPRFIGRDIQASVYELPTGHSRQLRVAGWLFAANRPAIAVAFNQSYVLFETE